MSVGDLVVANGQYEYSGLLLGSGTPYIVESIAGLFEIPSIQDSDAPRSDRHGVAPGTDLMGGRTLVGVIKLLEEDLDQTFTRILALQNAMQVSQIEEALVYQRRGITGKRYINCRPRKSSAPSDFQLAHGLGQFAVQLFASDPRHCSLTASQVTDTVPASSTSRAMPVIVNNGNSPADAKITLTGPATNPRFTISGQTALKGQSDNAKALRIDVIMNATDVLVLDGATKKITLNGVPTYNIRRADSEWWSLYPGNNTVTVTRDGSNVGAGAPVLVDYRDSWLY